MNIGPYKHVDFEDAIINGVIRTMGGTSRFIKAIDRDEKWTRKEFLGIYESFHRNGVNGEVCRVLSGLSEKEVVNGELVDCVPKLIECADVARLTHSNNNVKRIATTAHNPVTLVIAEAIKDAS